jgi:type II secretory pathway pseudopilin PulG
MRKRSDAGFTMIDVLVSMSVMVVVMAVATAGISAMYRSATAVEAKSVAQSQVGLALQRLDREIRYAQGISPEYRIDGDPYVDFLAVQGTRRQCIQLRLRGGQLAQRTWTYGSTPLDRSAWRPLADGITSARPFAYVAPSDLIGYQRLTLDLRAGAAADTATFTALNTDRTSANDYCAAGR